MKEFTSTARKDGRWWVVQCDQVPEALSQVARLDQAAEHQREAIAFVTELDEADIHVEVRPVLDEHVVGLLEASRRHRDQADRLAHEAAEEIRAAATTLAYQDYTLRDIGTILGVSHQRAHQLVQTGSR
jgi:DNA-directed RNA polymerase sigma subunit (sigma70/sigma32)